MKPSIRLSVLLYGVLCMIVFPSIPMAADGFTQADRERMASLEASFSMFVQQIDKRFEQIDKRFEQIDKRFEQVDKRFEQLEKRFEQIDKRFEQVDKRIEELRIDMNARFEQVTNLFYMVGAMFTTLFTAVFAFAWWDRRSVISTAKKAAREEVEHRTRGLDETTLTVNRILEAMRSLSEHMPELKDILRRVHLL